MNQDGWDGFHRRWSRLKPPLRANAEVVAAIGQAIAGHDGRALLLGVTPELADIARTTVAVDFSEAMIAHIWPGDSETRRALHGDWLALPPVAPPALSAVIGDGSLNVIDYADYPALFVQLERVLAQGARLAVRVYRTPEPCDSIEQVRDKTLAGGAGGFHALKWRLAMAIAAEARDPRVPVSLIHHVFQQVFPDRVLLSAATGWSREDIDEIDAYAGSNAVYSFPTRRELLAALPRNFQNVRFTRSGRYELAECCPILVADFTP